jgi:hypothetical protein
MFTKLAYLKSISLIMLAGKVFVDYNMFSWFEILGVVIIPAVVFVLLDGLSEKLTTWTEKLGKTSF